MKRNTYFYALCLVILPVLVSAQTPVAVDTIIIMSDGVQIDALYVMPVTPAPATGYPAILSVHGFSGNKNQVRSESVEFAKNGYVAAAYSVRGQGASGGTFDFFNSFRILNDLREVIAFTKSRLSVNPDRVGVIGGSQGGLHAWAASAYHMDVRAVISMIANGRLLDNWTENHAMNYTFAATIAGTTVRMAPHIRSTVQNAISTNNILPVQAMLDTFSTAGLERTATVPVMMMFSYYDQYFNPTPGLRQFHLIKAPKRAFTFPAQHSLSSDPTVGNALVFAAASWFEYWLKDNQLYAGILAPGAELTMFDGGDNMPHTFAATDTGIWLEADRNTPGVVPFKLWFNNNGTLDTARFVDPTTSYNYIGGLGGNKAIFRSAPMNEDVLLTGSNAHAGLITSGTASRYQTNVELYDYDPGTGKTLPITRGHYQINENTPATPEINRFYLNAMMHTVKAGHQIEARVHGGYPAVFSPTNNDVLATGITSENSLIGGGQASCYIQLYAYDPASVSVANTALPATPHLAQNYPNPFGRGSASGSVTTIEYATASPSAVLDVFNSMGQKIETLHTPGSAPGTYAVQFRADGLTGGVYFAVLRDGAVRRVLPMVVVQ